MKGLRRNLIDRLGVFIFDFEVDYLSSVEDDDDDLSIKESIDLVSLEKVF